MTDSTWATIERHLRQNLSVVHAGSVLSLLGEPEAARSIGTRWVPAHELLDIYGVRLGRARSRGVDVVDYERVVNAFQSADYTGWRIASIEHETNRFVLFVSKEVPRAITIFRSGQG